MLYAWPVDDDQPLNCDDYSPSLEVPEDATYDDIWTPYVFSHIKEMGEEPELPVRFWLVGPDTNRAANAVPFGEYDSETMKNNMIRKKILQSGLVREIRP